MPTLSDDSEILEQGNLRFTVESRILRELGERLVKQPEVALVELVKNAYDADATSCVVTYHPSSNITVVDDGHGMTLAEFTTRWMRIGTSSRPKNGRSRLFGRVITGEKGIGRFAVRFLGQKLDLKTVAYDEDRRMRTMLIATFDWPIFDRSEDLGRLPVPYSLRRAANEDSRGTSLEITRLRAPVLDKVKLDAVRTATITVVTPYQALIKSARTAAQRVTPREEKRPDPGFSLTINPASDPADIGDLARVVLNNAVLKAVIQLEGQRVALKVFSGASPAPVLSIKDRFLNDIGNVYADIRFFPQRKGTFTGLPIDGRRARTWLKEHSGVAVFDRGFRVLPYGTAGDDWLFLAADTVKRARIPRSSLAAKHFPMDELTRQSTQLNYMLRLPYPGQLIGVVEVEGRRSGDHATSDVGLIPAADREGFIDNSAFAQLRDLVRGAVEAIASIDRELQQVQEREEREETLKKVRAEVRDAIREIEANPNIRATDKRRIVEQLVQTGELVEEHEERAREREAALEVMSLLGVVAGFMTHEFGVALAELGKSYKVLSGVGDRDPRFRVAAERLREHVTTLRELVTYSQGYIQGAKSRPTRPYAVRPRIQQVVRVFGKYAHERRIEVEISVEASVMAPLVPVSLYNGIVLNLFTNALKAVTARSGKEDRRITFRVWNDQQYHQLEVSDTGVGIPSVLRARIFDPLFTTTGTNQDPLGSGMGLGLSLVKRSVESYGGRVEVTEPPPGFSTCFKVRLPMTEQ